MMSACAWMGDPKLTIAAWRVFEKANPRPIALELYALTIEGLIGRYEAFSCSSGFNVL